MAYLTDAINKLLKLLSKIKTVANNRKLNKKNLHFR